MVTFKLNYAQVAVFLAILLRLSLILFVLPFFGSNDIPRNVKALLALTLTVVLYLPLQGSVLPLDLRPASLIAIVMGEIFFAVVMSVAILTIFGAFQFAGDMIGIQAGFGFAQIADPQTGGQMMVLSGWFQLLASMIFFSLNGHHLVLKALVESYRALPLGGFALTPGTYGKLVLLTGQLFVIGLKLAAPVMSVFFLTQVGLGLIARFSPEINILMVSFPLTIILAFVFISFSVHVWGDIMIHLFGFIFQFLGTLIRA